LNGGPAQAIESDGSVWMIDLEITLAQAFGWSLRDIDETDIESLLPFVARIGKQKSAAGGKPETAYCDEVNWL